MEGTLGGEEGEVVTEVRDGTDPVSDDSLKPFMQKLCKNLTEMVMSMS